VKGLSRMNKAITSLFKNKEIGFLGQKMAPVSDLRGPKAQAKAIEILQELQKDVLLYKFKRPELLLNALTHRSAK